MHISQIRLANILNFKTFNADIQESAQLIAGPNNAGKSSLLRAVEVFFSNPDGRIFEGLKPLNSHYVNSGSRALMSIDLVFSKLNPDEEIRFDDVLSADGSLDIGITCTRKGKIDYRSKVKVEAKRAAEVYRDVISSIQFVSIPAVRVSQLGADDNDASLVRLFETLEKILITDTTRATAIQKSFANAMKPVERVVHGVLMESMKTIQSEMPFEEGTIAIEMPRLNHALRGTLKGVTVTSGDGAKVSISDRGTGFQSALVLGILRYVAAMGRQADSSPIFAIEEPEAFLHPQTQRALAKILRDTSAQAQMLITTHSSVIVDSFPVEQILRLPLVSDGLVLQRSRRSTSEPQLGKLTRYCDASNSELVFASAVIVVEGYGDKVLVEYLLGLVTGGQGGHYALGITVIEASGISVMAEIVKLAEYFDVRMFILTDKDGLKKSPDKRELLEVLKERQNRPTAKDLQKLRDLSDRKVGNLKQALEHQRELNEELAKWDSFVMSSDLEGLIFDLLPAPVLAEMFGPDDLDLLDQATVERFSDPTDKGEALAAWMGTKGWNCDQKTTNKLKPHLPLEIVKRSKSREDIKGWRRRVLRPLEDWLKSIIDGRIPAAL